MPSRVVVRPFSPSDIEPAAQLLAARHRADASRLPFLEPSLLEPDGARPHLDSLDANPRADGVVAEEQGRVVGFLFGERMLLSPMDMASLFVPPHSIAIPVEGHAVAEGRDPAAVYRDMYAELARDWLADGFFVHRAAIPAGDLAGQEAWVGLGFGRYLTAATRTTESVKGAVRTGVDIRRASPEEIDDVILLADALNAHHWESPMFWPVLPETEEASREFNLAQLRASQMPYFVAYDEGIPAGMQTFLKPGFTPPIVAREDDVYLFEGIVSPEVRGGGIGTALLAHAMGWARGEGLRTCTLHFAAGNPVGAPFWLGHGFVPVEQTMERRLDERITWARPREH